MGRRYKRRPPVINFGPIPFLLYANDIPTIVSSTDDTQLYSLCRTRYVGNCSSVGHDVRFERVVMVRGVYFDHIDVGRQAFS